MKKLRLALKNEEHTHFLEKQIDFIPSKGMIIYEPIYGIIGSVVYANGTYTASMADVLEPTDPENQLRYLKSMGFTEYNV